MNELPIYSVLNPVVPFFFKYKNMLVIYLLPFCSKSTLSMLCSAILALGFWKLYFPGSFAGWRSANSAAGCSRWGWTAKGREKWLPSLLLPVLSVLPKTGNLFHQQQCLRTSASVFSRSPSVTGKVSWFRPQQRVFGICTRKNSGQVRRLKWKQVYWESKGIKEWLLQRAAPRGLLVAHFCGYFLMIC